MLFDPQGGIFIHNSKMRRDFFKYRGIFYTTILDYNLKIKLAYIKRIVDSFKLYPITKMSKKAINKS